MKRKLLASKELVVFLITERSYRICRDFRCTDGLACLSSRYACGRSGISRLGESETALFLYNVMCDVARKGERVWHMYF